MSLKRACDSCHEEIIGLNWWIFRLKDRKTKGSIAYDLCENCKRKVMHEMGINKQKKGDLAA